MYSSYTTAALTLRAKSSYTHLSVERPDSCHRCSSCCCCCSRTPSADLSLYTLTLHPKLLYGYCLRQSTLIHWAPSRTFLSVRPRYRRLDGGYREVIGLLADIDDCYIEQSRFSNSQCESKIKEERRRSVKCRLQRDNLNSSFTSTGSKYPRHTQSSRREDVECRLRRGKLSNTSSSYSSLASSSFSGDSECEEDSRRKSARERSGYARKHEEDEFEREIREDVGRDSRKYSDFQESGDRREASGSRRVSELQARGRKERVESSANRGHTSREGYVREDGRNNWRKDSRVGSEKVSFTSEDDMRRPSTLRDVVEARKNSSASTEKYRSKLDQRVVGNSKASSSSTKLKDISAVYDSNTRRAFDSQRRVDDARVGTSTSGQYSAVANDQRIQMEQQSVDKLEVGNQHDNYTNVTMNRANDTVKQRSSNVEVDRQYENYTNVTGNRANDSIKQKSSNVEVDQQYENYTNVTRNRANDSIKQKSSNVEVDQQYENYTNVTGNRTNDSVRQKTSKVEVDRQYANYTNVSRNHTNDSVKQKSSNVEVDQQYENYTNVTRNRANDSVKQKSSNVEVDQQNENYTNITRNRANDGVKQASSSVQVNQQNENRTNVIMNRASDTVKQGSSKILAEMRTSDQEHHSTSSASLVQVENEQRNQWDDRLSRQYTTRKAFETDTRISELSSSEVERVSNSQQISNTRFEKENYSTSVVNLVGRTEQEVRTDNRDDNQYSSRRASESGVSSSEAEMVMRIQNPKKSSLQSTMVGESSRAPSIISDSNFSFSRTHIQALDDQTGRDATYDTRLGSASRSDKSSTMYVGEFVDKLRQEISTSNELGNSVHPFEIQVEDVHRTTQSATDIHSSFGNENSREESARQSSSTSGMKGPSVEMWDVRDPYSKEPSRPEEPVEDSSTPELADPARTDTAIARRSQRSLWAYISDIIKSSWVLRSGSQTSTVKSGARSASNESVSSEVWFSGHEPDENDDETDRKGVHGTPKEAVQVKSPVDLSHKRTHSAPTQASSEALGPGNQMILSGASSSFSKGSTRRGPLAKGTSDESKPEGLGIPFREAPIEKPSTLISSTVSPTIEDAIIEIGHDRTPGSGLTSEKLPEVGGVEGKDGELKRRKLQRNKQVMKESFDGWEEDAEELSREEISEVGGTEGTDGELRRRKLQRNKQVMKESFEGWEEAYIRETKQRKIDELFMREALLEAKKAADAWEVPVGAVLVQNGKIIARGCNLVEEARDSTAHAEMVCIREASTLLRTWRLSETTLYVTLEPCAMCAGAILQARIDTVVWGAPNKLLGADGSWVRLFPGGGDGGSNSDQPGETAGPVHPFHPKIAIRRGILTTECSDVMQQFFQLRRKKKKVPEPELPISTHPTKFFSKMHDLFCIMFCM